MINICNDNNNFLFIIIQKKHTKLMNILTKKNELKIKNIKINYKEI